jgi:hypothetical protein
MAPQQECRGMTDHPKLRIVETPVWNRSEAYAPDPIEMLRERLNRSLVDRIGDWLESELAVGIYVGIYIGMMLTVAAALLLSFVS